MDSFTTGHRTRWEFLEISNYQWYQKFHEISLKHLQKLWWIWKFEVPGSKLSPLRPLQFWTRNSCNSVNFEAKRMLKVPKFSKKYFQFLIFYHCLLSLERFLHNLRKRDIVFSVSPSCWSKRPAWGGSNERNIAFS